jgi:uncharacterized protein YndB with AHSA1/START domain
MSRVASVKKQVVLDVPQERAFRVFTAGIDRWWLRQHHIGKSPLQRTILEGLPGGRWYSVSEDATEGWTQIVAEFVKIAEAAAGARHVG